MTDQPTAGVALKPCPFDGEPARLIEGHKDHWRVQCSRCGANIGEFYTREDGKRKAVEAWNRRPTPASGPVEADDRLAVAVEALERIASYKWPVIVGHTTTTSIGQATGEVYESKWPVPKEGVLGALESVKTIAAQTLALLTSGEAGE